MAVKAMCKYCGRIFGCNSKIFIPILLITGVNCNSVNMSAINKGNHIWSEE
jgi:hypothetical protein